MGTVIHQLKLEPKDLKDIPIPIAEHRAGNSFKTLHIQLVFDKDKFKNALYCVTDYSGVQLMQVLDLNDAVTRYNAIQVPIPNPQPIE